MEEEDILNWEDSSAKKQGKTKDEIELGKIIDKIIEKAELIVKLVMPKSWDVENAWPIIFRALSEEVDRSVAFSEDDFYAAAG